MLRHADGTVEVVHDTHRTGLFPRATWLEVVDGAASTLPLSQSGQPTVGCRATSSSLTPRLTDRFRIYIVRDIRTRRVEGEPVTTPRDDTTRRSVFPGFAEMTPDIGELVDMLAERRRAHGLSQSQVADRMRTSQSAVARLESGQGDLRLSTLRRYAEALGQTLHFGVATSADGADVA